MDESVFSEALLGKEDPGATGFVGGTDREVGASSWHCWDSSPRLPEFLLLFQNSVTVFRVSAAQDEAGEEGLTLCSPRWDRMKATGVRAAGVTLSHYGSELRSVLPLSSEPASVGMGGSHALSRVPGHPRFGKWATVIPF